MTDRDPWAAGLSRQKVRYLYELARHVSEGRVALDALDDADDLQVLKTLSQVTGIGRWTVEMFLIFCLRRPDVLPVYDLGFLKAVSLAYSLDAVPIPARSRRWPSPGDPTVRRRRVTYGPV